MWMPPPRRDSRDMTTTTQREDPVMTHITLSSSTLLRTCSTVGAAAVLGLTLAGSALAKPDAGYDGSQAPVPATVSTHAHPKGHAGTTRDESSNAVESQMLGHVPNVGPPSYNAWPHGSGAAAKTPAGVGRVSVPRLPDGSVPYLQIGLGALGGAVLTGAAAGALASRGRHHALSA